MAGKLSREPGRKARRGGERKRERTRCALGESVDRRQEAGHPKFWLVCSDAVTAGVAIGSISNILFGGSSLYVFVPVEQAAPVQ